MTAGKKRTEQITIRLEAHELDGLRELGVSYRRPPSGVLRMLLGRELRRVREAEEHVIAPSARGEVRSYWISRGALYHADCHPMDWPEVDAEVSQVSAAPGFYVSCVDGPRVALPAGPFATHAEALAAVDAERTKWSELYPRTHFAAWGTCRVRADGEPAPELPKRRVRLPIFEKPPSEGRFRVYANSIGALCWRPAGEPPPDNGRWQELARVNMPRRSTDFNGVTAAYDALLRVYAL